MIPKRYRPAAAAGILIVFSLAMLSYSLKRPDVGMVRRLVMEAALPLEGAVNSALSGIGNAWRRYIFLVGLQEENQLLRKRNARLAGELIRYREGYLEGLRLRKLLALQDQSQEAHVAARVVDLNRASAFKTILIDRGTLHGLRSGLPVIGDEGLVGRITEASWHASRVLLLIDENSNVDALVEGSRVHGILQGSSSGVCVLKYVPKTEEVKTGDTIVTSGLSGLFSKGLLIGVVSGVNRGEMGLFQRIEVTPSVDFSRIEEVLVPIPRGRTDK